MSRFLTAAFALLLGASVASAAEITPLSGDAGPSRRDMSLASFDTYQARYRAQGFRMADVDAYRDGSRMRYAQNWRRNDGRAWAVERDLTSTQYSARFAVHSANDMRATDIEGYRDGNQTRFAGLWIQNTESIGWALWRNLSGPGFREKNREQADRGRVIVDAEAYMTSSGLRFAAIWYDDPRPQDTFFRRGLSRDAYQTLVTQKQSEGFKLVDFERYENDSGETRYIGLWKRGFPGRVIVKTNRNADTYRNMFRQYNDEGYRPLDFERDGNSYAGIWVEAHPSRARYAGKSALDAQLDAFLPSMGANAPPGISAAIVLNGTRIWQRGDGFSDISEGRTANAETLYYLASVSKPIAATLFGRLEERGRMENGRMVSLSASDTTRSHLPELPSHHTHQLIDLLGHTACIGSYGRGHDPDNVDYSRHFESQRAALRRYMNTALINTITDNSVTPSTVTPCIVGVTETYSNHGYGMLGAVMESATGSAYKDLLRSELADPFRLPSLRAMYADRNPVPTGHRSVPYTSQTNATSYSNSSWKVTVGGTEGNAMDLARFGWLTASARLTSATFRDNVLFQRTPNSRTAYAWRNTTDAAGRRVMRHNGAGTGSRTMLWIWPDDGLSIAILSNRNYNRPSGSTDPMRTLIQGLAATVFSNSP